MTIIHPSSTNVLCDIHKSIYIYIYMYIIYYNYNKYTYSSGMKERCRDGCRTSLLIAGVVLVPAIFHILLPPCHPYITIHFMEMIFFHLFLACYLLITQNYCINFTIVSFLFLPSRNGHLEVVRYLVTDGNCDLNAKTSDYGYTPLHLACL